MSIKHLDVLAVHIITGGAGGPEDMYNFLITYNYMPKSISLSFFKTAFEMAHVDKLSAKPHRYLRGFPRDKVQILSFFRNILNIDNRLGFNRGVREYFASLIPLSFAIPPSRSGSVIYDAGV